MNSAQRKTQATESDRKERLALAFTAACGIAITGGILASLVYLLVALASMMVARPAFGQAAPTGAPLQAVAQAPLTFPDHDEGAPAPSQSGTGN